MIDSHFHPTHLSDLPQVWAAAQAQGVHTGVGMANDRQSWSALIEWHQSSGQPIALGLHPLCADENANALLSELEPLLDHVAISAIGECGLDGGTTAPPMPMQLAALERQIEWAKQRKLALSLHSHRAVDLVCKQVRDQCYNKAVLHGFIGSEQQAERAIDQGLYLGVGGAVTYPRAQRLRRVLAHIPLDALVLESDAPYQPLNGQQGQANHPANISIIAATVAQLQGVEVDEVVAITTANAKTCFGL